LILSLGNKVRKKTLKFKAEKGEKEEEE